MSGEVDIRARRRARRADALPALVVIIDTEEEFDWARPISRDNRAVTSIAGQARAQAIFARYGIVPTYVVDYPVATDADAVATLRAFQDAGEALIGAHLHPWVTPPETEAVTPANSYPGNLPPALEEAKLRTLTDAIAASFGRRPRIYKAGRYGIGPNTPAILARLGYRVDASVVPHTEFCADGGPDFRHERPVPRAFDRDGEVMELPLSVGFCGLLRPWGPALYPPATRGPMMRLRLPGILARTRLLERIRLSPEGADAADHIRLTRALVADGVRVFSYTYHSPSLVPGHTPYVRTARALDAFLDRMDRYFDWFFGTLGGRATTPLAVRERWEREGHAEASAGAPGV
ncbi:MAG: polysaccharide deacetylase family protein [Rhodothalassiaceae bacterium]